MPSDYKKGREQSRPIPSRKLMRELVEGSPEQRSIVNYAKSASPADPRNTAGMSLKGRPK
jgi:hypothetical protein